MQEDKRRKPTVVNKHEEILEKLWDAADPYCKVTTLSKWRRIFKKHGLKPRRYLAVLYYGNGHYMIESESRSGVVHSVDLADHGCSCEDAQMRKSHCKHQQLIERLIEEDILPATK